MTKIKKASLYLFFGGALMYVAFYTLSTLGFSGVNQVKIGWDSISIYFITLKYVALLVLFLNYKKIAMKIAERKNNKEIYAFLLERRRLFIVAILSLEFIGAIS